LAFQAIHQIMTKPPRLPALPRQILSVKPADISSPTPKLKPRDYADTADP
jgi:hypothetical protein